MQEALQSDDAACWKQASDSEYESLMCNKAWDLVELPYNYWMQVGLQDKV